MIAERLIAQVEPRLATKQLGFRRNGTTSDVVASLLDHILRRFSTYTNTMDMGRRGKRTTAGGRAASVLFDLTAAFDKVDHAKLILKLRDMCVDCGQPFQREHFFSIKNGTRV